MRQLILILSILVFINCKKNNQIDDSIEIYSLIVSELGSVTKLKPTIDNLEYNSKLDSLNKERDSNWRIGVFSEKVKIENEKYKHLIPKEYEFLLKASKIDSGRIPFEKIKIKKGQLILVEEGKIDFDNLDIFLIFSDLIFNKKKTKAVIQCSKRRGKLNGGSYYCLLKKSDNEWMIDKVILLNIS